SALRGDRRWTAPDARTHYEELRDQGVVGVVVPSGDREGQVVLRNAEHITQPFALPVLQVASKDARALTAALVLGGVEGRLEVDGERLKSRASNVVATVQGSDPDARPLAVMTPKSGWFTCAAERGGGIAILLALAEALARETPARTVHFLASSGHELHHLGLEAYLHERPTLAQDAAAWLHLGASIGARFPAARMGASDDALHGLARDALVAAGCEAEAMEAGSPGGGEARAIAERGGRYVTFLGGHRYLHSPSDTVDLAVDAASVSRWGQAAWAVLQGMLALDD
ncbi:MAG: M28 family peptidase, partial [Dehalococcoidia bacterium]